MSSISATRGPLGGGWFSPAESCESAMSLFIPPRDTLFTSLYTSFYWVKGICVWGWSPPRFFVACLAVGGSTANGHKPQPCVEIQNTVCQQSASLNESRTTQREGNVSGIRSGIPHPVWCSPLLLLRVKHQQQTGRWVESTPGTCHDGMWFL